MKRLIVSSLVLVAVSCTHSEKKHSASHEKSSSDASAHNQAMYRPEQIVWKDGPPSLPPGAKVAILEGDPAKNGYFAMRLKFPDGYRVPAHTHPNVERVTIIRGTLHLGMGDKFDKASANALPAGSYSFMPPGMKHFAWAEGETELQLATMGPWAINYINPEDDPRNKK
jgi:quercetin dioxygenase-like cupin family protein